MQILIILLVFLLFGALLPILLPILSVVAIIVLGLNLRRMFSQTNFKRFDQENSSRNIFEREDYTSPEETVYEKDEFSDPLSNKPASVRDEKFWEQDHTVYDVPYEEAPPTDEDEDLENKN